MNETEQKYDLLSDTLNSFLKSTYQYVDHLKELKKQGVDIHSHAKELGQLSINIEQEYSAIRWAVRDIAHGNDNKCW